MGQFDTEYKRLNKAQQKAVDTIDGPVLVIAGPGTGKTQLLSMRVANILSKTDTAPQNILCLTFTDNAARNMRERLESIIGQAAYHVGIHTFHSFGVEVINQFPDYFSKRQLLQQIDELGAYELLRSIFESLPHSNPLGAKVGEEFVLLKDTLKTIGWLKQNALSPNNLHTIINTNEKFIVTLHNLLKETFASPPAVKNLASYQKLLTVINNQISGQRLFGFREYAAECAYELRAAIETTDINGRFAPHITAWRNKWCLKDALGNHVFKDSGRNMRKMHALANVYQQLVDSMAGQGLYDFDDMIIEVLSALETNDDLRFNLQERYQYVLVDEFQDTNKAQLRMLINLGDNPINENRPNIMVVGDDDQAIYAFQGAEVSNMVDVSKLYHRPMLITLRQNYRSTTDILAAGSSIANQISDRLTTILPNAHKKLTAETSFKTGQIAHSVFASELAQYDWIAELIERQIRRGAKPEDIAVISPRHKYLERLMPYLGQRHIPVAYERRENILDAPIIKQLITMARLVVALTDNQQAEVDCLLAEVLSYDFWRVPTNALIDLSMDCYTKHRHWLPGANSHKNKTIRAVSDWFVKLAKRSSLEPLEYMLDQFMGTQADGFDNEYDDLALPRQKIGFVSPMRTFYFNNERLERSPDAYLTLLGQLASLRQRLRLWKPNTALYIRQLVDFVDLHNQAKLKIIDTNPHTQTTNAVQVMTAYKAKGLEFSIVYIINAQDEVWGPTARRVSHRIPLPLNLPLAPAGDEDNDKLRLLFVAVTRAKHTLHITSYTHSLDNKLSPGLSFIGGNSQASAAVHPTLAPHTVDRPSTVKAQEILSTDWAYRFRQIIAGKTALFEPILTNYKLSVTHLNNFVDVASAGPKYFFMHNLLRFPQAPTPSAAYGDAVHKTLQWAHSELRGNNKLPTIKQLQLFFTNALSRKHLRAADHKRLEHRGIEAVKQYFIERGGQMAPQDLVERGFNNEGVVVGDAELSGKIDKIHFTSKGTVQLIDFKTGKPSRSWQGKDEFEKIKLHKYRQQLLVYKLLVENSASFGNKLSVDGGALEFIEPDEHGKLADNLVLSFNAEDIEKLTVLIKAVWQHITNLNFPDTSHYPPTLKGIERFENDLLNGKI